MGILQLEIPLDHLTNFGSTVIAGWDYYFLKVLLANSEERVLFPQES